MTSMRWRFMQEIADKLVEAQPDWNIVLRGVATPTSSEEKPVTVVVFPLGEDKVLATNDQYSATLRVGLAVEVENVHADPILDAGNPLAYLDRMIVLIEQAIHATDYTTQPSFSDLSIEGHEVTDPAEPTGTSTALIRVRVTYRHHWQDPEL